MYKCAIIANGYCRIDAMTDQVESIKNALLKREVCVDVIYTDRLIAYLKDSNVAVLPEKYLFIVYLDKDVYLSRLLEKSGYRLINSAKAIELCDDKMKTYITLAGENIAFPDTVSSPLNYACVPDNLYAEIENRLGYPVVVKEVYGSMGKSVYLCKNRDELISMRNSLIGKPHLYQKFTGAKGKDIRVIVIGKKAIGAMQRVNKKDFRSNIQAGGEGYFMPLNEELKAISEKAANVLGLDYCGVDVLEDNGKYYICEVNSNAFFKGFTAATGIDVAEAYADFLVKKYISR